MLPLLATSTSSKNDNPFKPVLHFFSSRVFRASVQLALLLVFALYLALVFWTYKDARRRIADPVLVAVAVATALVFPFVGVLIYVILRPPEYLDDVRERELEIRAMERRLGADLRCPYCRTDIEPTYLSCPVCTSKLKDACRRCQSPLDPEWRICPYCETATGGVGLVEEPVRGRLRKAKPAAVEPARAKGPAGAGSGTGTGPG